MYSRELTAKEKKCRVENTEFRESLVAELQTACQNIPRTVYPLCQKYKKYQLYLKTALDI